MESVFLTELPLQPQYLFVSSEQMNLKVNLYHTGCLGACTFMLSPMPTVFFSKFPGHCYCDRCSGFSHKLSVDLVCPFFPLQLFRLVRGTKHWES